MSNLLTLSIDGIGKLPEEFVDKLIQYGMFDVEMCHNVVAKYEDKEHSMKSFKKTATAIASRDQVSGSL